jgi:hypothetical protein
VIQCDSLSGDIWWSGRRLAGRAETWTRLLTDGQGRYCTTQQEDNAAFEALRRAGAAGLEAREVARLLELHLEAVELHDLDARLAALEARQKSTALGRRLGAVEKRATSSPSRTRSWRGSRRRSRAGGMRISIGCGRRLRRAATTDLDPCYDFSRFRSGFSAIARVADNPTLLQPQVRSEARSFLLAQLIAAW